MNLNTAGIYLLRWEDTPYFYIGKSINIKERLLQHEASFKEETAASKLQWAYEEFGLPSIRVLAECHRDNIDVLEAYYINFYRSEFMLNTSIPPYPFEGVREDVIEEILSNYATLSLGELSTLTMDITLDLAIKKQELSEAEQDIEVLKVSRTKQELAADISGRLVGLSDELNSTKKALAESLFYLSKAETRLNEIYKLPWYKKIFVKPQ